MRAADKKEKTSPATSHGSAVRASSIIGGASFLNIAFGLIRMKIAAVVLGPTGVGVIGLLQNLLNVASTVAGLNIGIAGSRQIVERESTGGQAAAASARGTIFLTTLSLTCASSLIFWLLSPWLAELVFRDPHQTSSVRWLVVGLIAMVASGYQTAALTGARRIGDLARTTVLSAVIASFVGSVCVLLWGADGILPFILASPIANFLVGWFYVRRVRPRLDRELTGSARADVNGLVRLGAALTISIFVSLSGQLLIRSRIEADLGPVQLGHFQAAWIVTVSYLAFIFQAMGSDYLPRLTAAMAKRDTARRLVADQTEVGLLLAAPVLLLMIGLAPWVLTVLYTSEFVQAETLLRWQVIGDLVRLASWPIGFVLLAGGASRDYTIADVSGTAILVVGAVILLPVVGLAGVGIAYAVMNLCYLGFVAELVRRRFAITPDGAVYRIFASLALSCVAIFGVSHFYAVAGGAISIVLAAGWSWFGFQRLRRAGAIPFLA